MTDMPSYVIESQSYKPKKRYYYSSSMIFILLLSIFTYVLIFYVFQVSPLLIFKDTKVLFFISNNLILIIAADYDAFTDKESHDFYGEYAATAATMRNSEDNYSPVPVFTYRENSGDAETKNPKEEEPMVKEIVCALYPPEKIVRVVSDDKTREDDVAIEKYKPVTNQIATNEEACRARNHINPKPYGRSKSDKTRRVKITEDTKTKRKSYGRSESDSSKWMVVPEKWETVEEESEEFSKMSNEELNKRVEDFIQRFNRQIKL